MIGRRQTRLEWSRQLSSIPVRNEGVRTVAEQEDRLVLELALHYPRWLRPLVGVLKLRTHRRFQLDGIGREVYGLIDGRTCLEGLVDAFGCRHKLTFLESRSLLMQYMDLLMRRGLIAVAVRRTDQDDTQ